MKLPSFMKSPKLTEIIRVQLPLDFDTASRQRLLGSLCELTSNLLHSAKVTRLELLYGPDRQHWVFELPSTHAISFNTECIWIPDPKTQKIVPFHLHYIYGVYITAEV